MKIDRSSPVLAQVADASSVQLVLVLMNGLLDEMMRARTHIEHGRYEAKGRSIDKCIELFATLINALDDELSSEAAMQLDCLHDHCIVRLSQASQALDVDMVDEVIELVITLRDAWQRVEDCSV